MVKNEVLQRIDAVCKTLDGGITVSGAQNAGNLAGCFAILQETLAILSNCEITEKKETESDSKED
jgi:hypothetical protein